MKHTFVHHSIIPTTSIICGLVFAASIGISTLNAQSGQFTVEQEITGSDEEAPTTPTDLSATAVATTQIDLSWTASTDNTSVDGYQVYRDGAFIATSSATEYQDTSLTASTAYDYTVRAFDTALNYSSTSATATATTLADTSTSTGNTGSSGGTPRADITDVAVDAELYRVTLGWSTSLPTQSIVRWGRTGSYELGSLKGETYTESHETIINELAPDTVYSFQIESTDGHGRTVYHSGRFRTAPLPDVAPPMNVSAFSASREGADILLSWQNPPDDDFSYVRILRSDTFYPSDPYDGFIIYENDGEVYRDAGAASETSTRYYTAFAYDDHGNISSGVTTRVDIDGTTPRTSTSTPAYELSFTDIMFIQKNVLVPVEADDTVRIDGSAPLTIAVEQDLLPSHVRTVLAELKEESAASIRIRILLRPDHSNTRYEGTISAFERAGTFAVTLRVFDHERKEIVRTEGTLIVEAPTTTTPTEEELNILTTLANIPTYIFMLILIVFLMLAYIRIQRSAKI